MHNITPINMSEDSYAVHIVYSVCCPIVGTILSDYNNMIVFNAFNACCHVWCIALDKTCWIAYSLGRWLLLWKAGSASIGNGRPFSIHFGWNQCWSIHYVIQSTFSISITIINGHRTICHGVNAAIRICWPIYLSHRQQYLLPEQYTIA